VSVDSFNELTVLNYDLHNGSYSRVAFLKLDLIKDARPVFSDRLANERVNKGLGSALDLAEIEPDPLAARDGWLQLSFSDLSGDVLVFGEPSSPFKDRNGDQVNLGFLYRALRRPFTSRP
jgi:hypothetical protein